MLLKSPYQYGVTGKFLRYVVKPMVIKTLEYASDHLAEPTKDNTSGIHSHQWIELRDWWLEHEVTKRNWKVVRGLFNIIIAVCDFDLFWRERRNKAIEKIKETEWSILAEESEPRPLWWNTTTPRPHWHLGTKCEKGKCGCEPV